ncbi:hypothetical protein TNCV_4801471 [Trichonephila clavipes]|nr:hypothetical protein TNCV_4801471 [Trichonephila clavipes]
MLDTDRWQYSDSVRVLFSTFIFRQVALERNTSLSVRSDRIVRQSSSSTSRGAYACPRIVGTVDAVALAGPDDLRSVIF